MTNVVKYRLSLSGLTKGTSLEGRELAPGTVLFEGTLAPGITAADLILLTRRHGLEIAQCEDEPADNSARGPRRKLQGAEV